MRGPNDAGAAGRVEPSARFETAHLDFEEGFAGWNLSRLVGPHSAAIQSDVVRAGTKACRFELRPGDYISQGRRAELRDPLNAPLEATIWYGFATYIPEDYPVGEDVGCVLAQWHDQAVLGDPSGKPPIALRYRNGALKVTGAYGKFASPDPDRRYEFARVPDLELRRLARFRLPGLLVAPRHVGDRGMARRCAAGRMGGQARLRERGGGAVFQDRRVLRRTVRKDARRLPRQLQPRPFP